MSAISLLCEGVVDWDAVAEISHKYASGISGALFGAAWWLQADSLIIQRIKHPDEPAAPGLYLLPGILATFAMIMINCTRREDLANPEYLSEGVECRLKFWLFFSYVVAFGSLFGSVWVLLDSRQQDEHVWAGAVGVGQCTLIIAAGLVMWLFRAPGEESIYF